MYRFLFNSFRNRNWIAVLVLLAMVAGYVSVPCQKEKEGRKEPVLRHARANLVLTPRNLVWPSPPNIGRIRWVDYFAGAKIDYTPTEKSKPKASWMDRLAGGQTEAEKVNPKTFPFQMIGPYGIAIDSKGLVYVADQRVGAVFIFNRRHARLPDDPKRI